MSSYRMLLSCVLTSNDATHKLYEAMRTTVVIVRGWRHERYTAQQSHYPPGNHHDSHF